MAWRSHLFVCTLHWSYYPHYDLSESIAHISGIYQVYSVECVSKIKSTLAIFFNIYLCVLNLSTSLLNFCDAIWTWSYHHRYEWMCIIGYYLGLRHEIVVLDACLFMFLKLRAATRNIWYSPSVTEETDEIDGLGQDCSNSSALAME